MSDLLVNAVPYTAKFVAAYLLVRMGRYFALQLLLVLTTLPDIALDLYPEIWSVPGYIINNGMECLLIVLVAIDASRRCFRRREVAFRILMLALAAAIGVRIFDTILPGSVIRQVAAVHFAAGAACGAVAAAAHDEFDAAIMRWLFVTRLAWVMRLALFDIGGEYSRWANGVIVVAWAVLCWTIVRHASRDDA